MNLHFPQSPELADLLRDRDRILVACLCAAWCDTCKQYQPKVQALAEKYPHVCFVWIDIEDYADLLGDDDIENFPTVFIEQRGLVSFAGTLLPHIEHLERIVTATLEAAQAGNAVQTNSSLANLRSNLIARL